MDHDSTLKFLDGMQELLDRMRRVETRVTKFLMAQGFETGVQKPGWRGDGSIELPSPACGMKDILEVVPPEWDKSVGVMVMHKGSFVAELYLEEGE